ncbi:conserved hypothetical protein [Halobacteriovorax marinus SJ]|uniref:Uncharacterized protein n=1 Tax=Halobacteriovorax marinus (strain ATCC BAA-682 / DSM 15412 / SJ) TaxID=862908 RepID=E1X0C0_HALMS|nr:hypothetical protein [Halobacteriovorax marinus]CBW26348.1 conserved hypothetical protein [Halobacteriovorax marinus SJ]
MSDEDEIGEKSDMTRIEDLSEFLHQDDPEVDAALNSEDEPPSTEHLPGLDDLEDDEENEMDSFSAETEDDFQSDDDSQVDFSDNSDEFQDSSSDEDYSFDSTSDDGDSEDDTPDFSVDSEESDDFSDFQMQDEDESSFDSDDDYQFGDSSDEFSTQDEDSEDEDENEEDDFQSFDSGDFQSDDEESDADDESEDYQFGDNNFSEDSEQEQVEEEQEEEEQEEYDQFNDSFEDDNDSNSDFQAEETPEQSATSTLTEITPVATPQSSYSDRSEKFEDVKSFAKNITYGKIAQGGNPPFSVILRNVKYEEDAEDILIILREHELVGPDTEVAMQQSLEGGSLLISQISEYAAIYLTHKFRRFDLDIQMGLSDELHPSKSYEADSVGLVSKSRVNQNKNETMRIDKSSVDIESIIISTTPTLENYKIIEYLGIVSDFTIVDEDELTSDQNLTDFHERQAKGHVDQDQDEELQEEIELKVSQSAIYNDLSEKLRPQCMKKNANAIVGINYQITPLGDGSKYKISCSGSAVWVIDNN